MNEQKNELKNLQRDLFLLLEAIADSLFKNKRKNSNNDKNYLPYDGEKIEEDINKILEVKGKISEDEKTIIYEDDKYKFIRESNGSGNKTYAINKTNGEKVFDRGHITKFASNDDAKYLKNIQTFFTEIFDNLDDCEELEYDGEDIEENINKILELKGVKNDDGTITYKIENYLIIKDDGNISIFNNDKEKTIFENSKITQHTSEEDLNYLKDFSKILEKLEKRQNIQSSIEKIVELKGVEDTRFNWKYFNTQSYSLVQKTDGIYVFNSSTEEIIFKNGEFTEKASNEDVEHVNSLGRYVQHLIDYPDSKYYGKEIEDSIEEFINKHGTNDDATISYETQNYHFLQNDGDKISITNKQSELVIFENSEFTQEASADDVNKMNIMCEHAQNIIDNSLSAEENLNHSSGEIDEDIEDILEEEYEKQSYSSSPVLRLTR
ncbi:hypothetical protein [Mastigocoleus testarum]|uniref:Uncharacterized protein n=1 Tax=Mastigocoleus testarum BC008 TaxID=371196 RepID=A0A0V7ZCI9_9CYAN|nr:hypothetical protein [Mastigocoleus testarum]KST62227.1 hypothetical protein BC008_08635 [Mastigocoleus testarum BC008]